MKNKMKSLVAIMLLGTTLCSGMLTAQAATARADGHTHDYRETFSSTIRSVHTTHQYADGVIRDVNGKVIGYTYDTGDIMIYVDEYIYKCVHCTATTGSTSTHIREVHSVSH